MSSAKQIIILQIFLITGSDAIASQSGDLWIEESTANGITVWTRQNQEGGLVSYRAKTQINAPIKDVFAVLYDGQHKSQLLENSASYEVLDIHSKTEFTIYNQVNMNSLFISNRDIVFKTAIEFDPHNHTITARFWNVNHPLKPPTDGIVRIEECKGMWQVQWRSNNSTLLTYEVEVDPGGWLPIWLVNYSNRTIPRKTIENMRRQVAHQELYTKSHKILSKHFEFFSELGLKSPTNSPSPPSPEE